MRSKLRLDLNTLSIDSFPTSRMAAKAGTVFGEQCTCPTACTCPGCPTCNATCDVNACGQNTAQASCNGSCDFSCNYTDCDCAQPTCQQTDCGRIQCCA